MLDFERMLNVAADELLEAKKERDELRAKLDRVKEIANDLSDRPPEPAVVNECAETWAELFSIADSRLDRILKEYK